MTTRGKKTQPSLKTLHCGRTRHPYMSISPAELGIPAAKEALLKNWGNRLFHKWICHQQNRGENVYRADRRRAKYALFSFNLIVVLKESLKQHITKNIMATNMERALDLYYLDHPYYLYPSRSILKNTCLYRLYQHTWLIKFINTCSTYINWYL